MFGISAHRLQNQRENGTEGIHGEIIQDTSLRAVNGADIFFFFQELAKKKKKIQLPGTHLLKDLLLRNIEISFESFHLSPSSQ